MSDTNALQVRSPSGRLIRGVLRGLATIVLVAPAIGHLASAVPHGATSPGRLQTFSAQYGRVGEVSCSPQRLKKTDTLTLHMTAPHGRDLAILGPDKQFYFLVFWQPDPSGPLSLTDWQGFDSVPELKLVVAETKAPIVDGRGWHVPGTVFAKRGTYRILLGVNLETEKERGGVTSCDVFFEGLGSHK